VPFVVKAFRRATSGGEHRHGVALEQFESVGELGLAAAILGLSDHNQDLALAGRARREHPAASATASIWRAALPPLRGGGALERRPRSRRVFGEIGQHHRGVAIADDRRAAAVAVISG